MYFHPYEKYNKDDRPIQTIATGLNKTDIRAGHEFKKPPIYLSSDQLINTANDNARKWKNCWKKYRNGSDKYPCPNRRNYNQPITNNKITKLI